MGERGHRAIAHLRPAHLSCCGLFFGLCWVWIAALLQQAAQLLSDGLEAAHDEGVEQAAMVDV